MKNTYSIIESNPIVMDKLLDNCTVQEIEDFYSYLDNITLRTILWYCRSNKNRKMIKLLLDEKLDLNIRYEFTPIHDEEL